MSTMKRRRNGQFAPDTVRPAPPVSRARKRPVRPAGATGPATADVSTVSTVLARYTGMESFRDVTDRFIVLVIDKVSREHPEYDAGDVIAVVSTRMADVRGEHIGTIVGRVEQVYAVMSGSVAGHPELVDAIVRGES